MIYGLVMPSPNNPSDFTDYILRDFNWRLREISSMKLLSKSGKNIDRNASIRSLVVMCYAHWEGHVKYCAQGYVDYISRRRLRFSQLNDRFYQVRFLKELTISHASPLTNRAFIVEKILSSKEDRLSSLGDGIVNTRSNLNSDVLGEICFVCSLDSACFSGDADFIDRLLLKRRNEIAHGEESFVASVEIDDLSDRTISLMRKFRDLTDNAITQASYRSS